MHYARKDSIFIALIFLGLAIVQLSMPSRIQGQENVLLVVNDRSRSSKLIANHYVELRSIPDQNVVLLKGIPDRERISSKLFRSQILKPILAEIEKRKLGRQIDYVVYSADFPTQIAIKDEVKSFMEAIAKATGRKTAGGMQKIYNPMASINSMTYFVGRVLADEPTWIALDANQYMRRRNSNLLKTPFIGDLAKSFDQAQVLQTQKKYAEANEILAKLAQAHPRQMAIHYLMARNFAQLGETQKAVEALDLAVQTGWSYRAYTRSDIALSSLMDDPAMEDVLGLMPEEDYKFLPTVGFRRNSFWGKNGMSNASPAQGESYWLSTVLAVTRNQGISEEQALQQLARSARADGSQPKGYFGFANTGDVRSKTRRPNFAFAVESLKRLGQRAEVFNGKLPRSKSNIAGLSIGTASFSLASSGCKILPGAICENLTSYGGALEPKRTQTKLSEFLRFGAAGSSGTVIEPFAIQKKFPHPNIHVHYVKGCTLAEAFYQSVHGPFQLLIVGDALCRPWARIPKFQIAGVRPQAKVSGVIVLQPQFGALQDPLKNLQIHVDGVKSLTSNSFGKIRFDTRILSDGYHELRFVAETATALRTTSRFILPLVVDNSGLSCEASLKVPVVKESDNVVIEVKSKGADRIEVRQYGRTLGGRKGAQGRVTFKASLIGRGKSRVTAVAYHGNQAISSVPITIQVKGEILREPRKVPPAKKPQKPRR